MTRRMGPISILHLPIFFCHFHLAPTTAVRVVLNTKVPRMYTRFLPRRPSHGRAPLELHTLSLRGPSALSVQNRPTPQLFAQFKHTCSKPPSPAVRQSKSRLLHQGQRALAGACVQKEGRWVRSGSTRRVPPRGGRVRAAGGV